MFSRHFSQKCEVKSLLFSLSLRLDFLERFPMLSISLAHVHLGQLKDPLEKDGTNPVPNTDWSSGVCCRVPDKC